ncbi:alpha/beta fold hydrolase [Pseudomonas turukhanskensis]|uniref:Alpha/beta hydrolase n=1 Tax=Pseudomonas turukhanskensis TaxID=1806536 RepID=A0A9W6NHR6_9PSED|nr:alpha/beta fold hydrolase [Pseudomonas turukhanskensis]GLK91031.1 alpha/beta hydrolase [Pseudomonas turukhanskensis]
MSLATHIEQFATLPNGLRLCYASHGDESAPVVLLIAGLGVQMVYWPAVLIEQLVTAGYRVVCFDNRDAGRSARAATPHPSKWQQLTGKAPAGSYSLEDMADDTALLLDHLGIGQAHLVGMSMGGMIAQTLAYRHPQKAASLVSIFSTTGHRKVGQPALSTLWRMARAKAPRNQAQAVESYRSTMTHIGEGTAPGAQALWENYASQAWLRNGERADARALFRQIGAILKSGDRTPHLRSIQVPCLVVHGDQDRMVHPSGGVATAQVIPNARHEVIAGMRHEINAPQAQRLAALILHHIGQQQ